MLLKVSEHEVLYKGESIGTFVSCIDAILYAHQAGSGAQVFEIREYRQDGTPILGNCVYRERDIEPILGSD